MGSTRAAASEAGSTRSGTWTTRRRWASTSRDTCSRGARKRSGRPDDRAGPTAVIDALSVWLFVSALGLAALPYAELLFPRLAGRGVALALPLGLLLAAYP